MYPLKAATSKAVAGALDTCAESHAVEQELQIWAVQASRSVSIWDPSRYAFVRRLSEAPANTGVVDLVQMLDHGKMGVVVKQMPNWWVCRSPIAFEIAHCKVRNLARERPWSDLGITKYLNSIGFPFMCTLHGIFRDDASTYVVSSFATEGDLFSWISKAEGLGQEYQAQMRLITFQLFCAICWLHELGISHGDLSLENIVLTSIGRGLLVQLIDFGLATSERVRWGTSGKLRYMAPEMHHGGYDTFTADNFALGVVLFSLASQDRPWLSTDPAQCKAYAYVRKHGLRSMLRAKRCRKQRDTRLSQLLGYSLGVSWTRSTG
jgi:serine/threonine protein kinase